MWQNMWFFCGFFAGFVCGICYNMQQDKLSLKPGRSTHEEGSKMDKKAAMKICELCLLALSGGILVLPFLGEGALDKTLFFPEQ